MNLPPDPQTYLGLALMMLGLMMLAMLLRRREERGRW